MGVKLDVVPYKWNDHMCYIGKVRYKELESIVDIRSDISMNRKIDERRVDKIKQYILNDIPATFFPPTILNSKAEISYKDQNVLEVKRGCFTVIDGQHRIKAIISLMNESGSEQRDLLNRMELPIFIVEGLEDYQHRDLFYMINETPKNVESNVSERFAPKLENLLGLKFISNNKMFLNSIEWNDKQSREKIVYLHMTDCIRELNLIIYPLIKDWFDCERDLIYQEAEYYGIVEGYWLCYFELIDTLGQEEQGFFRKKITLRALIENLSIRIRERQEELQAKAEDKEILIDQIKQVITNSLNEMINKMPIRYTGMENVRKDVYKSLRNYLYFNSLLQAYTEQIINNSIIQQILEKIFEAFYDERKLLTLSTTGHTTDGQIFEEYITKIISNKEEFLEYNVSAVKEIAATKQTIMDEILSLRRKEL
ncbi:DNA sulfur modification protein DndB [Paenibacillus sp. RRE4]|uniref:DNA sulfur modification protein DndB n=1 Tax=Paenibacillus sp. RRE4 TaxID=2962587 RepID=UPI002881A3F4|nr:DNA sulfur modification protein DndB [Paenibacillus sp. RRE4]MDT0121081.1 DNA sulfur modification protein DndB [Paenibacillus sp. RRE4]